MDSIKKQKYFKIKDSLREDLYNYLNTKTISEVEYFMANYFEKELTDDDYLTEEFINNLILFLTTKCKRIEVKELFNRITSASGEVLVYHGTLKNEQSENTN